MYYVGYAVIHAVIHEIMIIILIAKLWVAVVIVKSKISNSDIVVDSDYDKRINNLRIFTCNIDNAAFNMIMKGTYLDECNLHRMEMFSDNYDVICLQECFVSQNLYINTFISHMQEKGYINWVVPDSTSAGTLTDSGLVILSRLPIISIYNEVFTHSAFPDTLASKGFVHIEIACRSFSNINVINSHLQSSYTVENLDHSSIRAMQYAQIAAYIKGMHNVILCGDLNIISNSAEYYDMLHVVGLNDLTKSLSYTNKSYYDTDGNIIGMSKKVNTGPCDLRKVDYVLSDMTGTSQVLYNQPLISDHYPIVCEVPILI